MEVRSELGIMSDRELFGVGLQNIPVQSQPSMHNMRLAFTPDGVAIYKQVNSSSPTFLASAVAGEAPGGGEDGVAVPKTIAPHGLNMNKGELVKRKRGRPRKYGAEGTMSLGLNFVSSSPVVAAGSTGFSSPFVGTAPNPASSTSAGVMKKPRGRPPGSGKKQQMAALGNLGLCYL